MISLLPEDFDPRVLGQESIHEINAHFGLMVVFEYKRMFTRALSAKASAYDKADIPFAILKVGDWITGGINQMQS